MIVLTTTTITWCSYVLRNEQKSTTTYELQQQQLHDAVLHKTTAITYYQQQHELQQMHVSNYGSGMGKFTWKSSSNELERSI